MRAAACRLSSYQPPEERIFLFSKVLTKVLNLNSFMESVSIPEPMAKGADNTDCPGHRSILRTRKSELRGS